MNNFLKIAAIAAMTMSGGAAFAKGHNQSGSGAADDMPGGDDVRTVTVCGAQGLGSTMGNGKGPGDNAGCQG